MLTVDLFYDNQSAFHGDGERVWVSRAGQVTVELLEPGSTARFESKLTQAETTALAAALTALAAAPVAEVDRLGIPDEVRTSLDLLGDRHSRFEVWSGDWGKQPPTLAKLYQLLMEVKTRALKEKAVRGPLNPSARYWPKGFPRPK